MWFDVTAALGVLGTYLPTPCLKTLTMDWLKDDRIVKVDDLVLVGYHKLSWRRWPRGRNDAQIRHPEEQ